MSALHQVVLLIIEGMQELNLPFFIALRRSLIRALECEVRGLYLNDLPGGVIDLIGQDL